MAIRMGEGDLGNCTCFDMVAKDTLIDALESKAASAQSDLRKLQKLQANTDYSANPGGDMPRAEEDKESALQDWLTTYKTLIELVQSVPACAVGTVGNIRNYGTMLRVRKN